MALAYDASAQGGFDGDASFSWTHTPAGTPKGIFVGTTQHATLADEVSGVTYGGVAMTRVGSVTKDAAEDGTAVAWFLGSGIPTGAQTVTVTLSTAAPSGFVQGYSVSVTAGSGKNTQLAGIGFATSTTNLNPSTTITGIAGASYGFGVLYSGANAVGDVTAGSGMTMRQQFDEGNTTGHVESSTSENASGDLTIAFTQAADEAALVGMAIEEVAAASSARRLALLGVG